MIIASSKEYAINGDTLDMANNRLKPDDDLRRAISTDEFLERVKRNIHNFYASKKNESINIAGS
jgi:hypothetical protein